MKIAALCVAAVVAVSGPIYSQDNASADIVAGEHIFDGTTHVKGCIKCHGPEGLGSEVDDTYAGNNIQGKTAQEIRVATMALPMMWSVKLDDDELRQVAAYLGYLKNQPNDAGN